MSAFPKGFEALEKFAAEYALATPLERQRPFEHTGRDDEPGREMRRQAIAVALAGVERERAGGHAADARVVDARRQRGGRQRVLVDDRQG